ncbi:MAG: ROK family protein, partial [Bacteroidaceae bacterium]|nr:ROK family protein [Bacteroidaceae bacterium]
EERLGYGVTIDNDTRAMTYGEFMSGCVKGERNIIYVNISWGIGIGIIIDGKVYNGKSGFAGEFGHIPAYDNEIICHCGKKGCLETETSGSALHRILLERVRSGERSIVATPETKANELDLDDIITAISKEDLLCIEIVEEIGQKLGKQIAGLINIFNPELVIIGGTLSLTGDYITQPIKTAVRKYSLNLVNKDSVIITSKLREKAGAVGACMLARSRMFEDTYAK